MATIQILEIRPVEYEVEELSLDITSNIRGGVDVDDNAAILDCLGIFFEAVDSGVSPLTAIGNLFDCLALVI